MWENLDEETREIAMAHIRKLEHLALTERKTSERGADAVRSLAIMAYLVGYYDDPPPDDWQDLEVSAEIIELAGLRRAA